METGEEAAKAAKATQTQEWPPPMQMQAAAYYGGAQPPFFPSAAVPYPYMWGPQAYGAPLPYPPALYPHPHPAAAGLPYPHPNITPGAALIPAPIEGKGPPVKSTANDGNGKPTSGSANDAASASHSAESGSEESSDGSEDNITHKGKLTKKKHSFDQMLADGNPAGPTNLNMGIELWNASPIGGVPITGTSNPSGVLPAVVPVARGGREGPGSDHLWVQDERELKRQRRKLSNRESARRSRLRKQAECEELQVKVESLSDENNNLRKELERLADERQKLAIENTSLVSELSQLYGEDAISSLKGKNDNTSVLQSIYGQGNGHDQGTSRGNNSLSD